ncbi:MAG: histidine kinase dimerization/phospho-acceptor domain-containing protein [Nitratireductor sp.]
MVVEDLVNDQDDLRQTTDDIGSGGQPEIENDTLPSTPASGEDDLADEHGYRAELDDLDETASHVDTSILEQLPAPVLVYRNGATLFVNSELLKLTGYSNRDEFARAGGVDAILSGTDDDGDENANGRTTLICKDGSSLPINPLLQTVPWDGGKALLLTFRPSSQDRPEVNVERAALDIARVSELQNILDTATDGIIVMDRDGIVESVNASAEALFGTDFDKAKGRNLTEFFAQESHKTIHDYISEITQPGVAGILNDGREVIGKEANGGLIPLFITIGRMGSDDKLCLVLRDMTQWKKAEEELVGARRSAELASEQKSDFLARVSHEIRTPLNAIIGFSDIMIEERFGPVGNERYREYLRDINRSGVHVLDLINDLLDISKIEAGKMELTYEAVDLNQIASETVALLQPQANRERIIIRTSLSRAVPRVVADARSIRQIILNLVSNAIKFTPMNGQVIVSTVYEGNGEVALRVRDTGRGMSEKEIESAMKPFQQIGAVEEKRGQGTGLGLP